MENSLAPTARLYKALGHSARLRILAMLRGGELCACQITAVLDLAPSTVSAHLADLRRTGLIVERRQGRWIHYRLAETHDAHQLGEWLWQRIGRDPQVSVDGSVVKQLRRVPVEQLCSVHLDLREFGIASPARPQRIAHR